MATRDTTHCTRLRLTVGLLALSLLAAAGCGGKPSYFRDDIAGAEPGSRVAVLPLVNLTKDVNAPDVVMNALVVELLATNRFVVIDPGVVEEVIQRERIRLTDRIPLETLQGLGAALGVDYVFVGSVNEYQMTKETQDLIPTVSIALRMVSCSTGAILWASTHSKRGNDTETVFTLGRIETLEELTSITAREMARTVVPPPGKKGPAPENSTP
jgi:hypothetical protein